MRKLTDDEHIVISHWCKEYDVYTSDPWRHDFCDQDCDCDNVWLEHYVDMAVKACPSLVPLKDKVRDMILTY